MGFYLAGVGVAVVSAALAYAVTKWCVEGRPVLSTGEKHRPVEPAQPESAGTCRWESSQAAKVAAGAYRAEDALLDLPPVVATADRVPALPA